MTAPDNIILKPAFVWASIKCLPLILMALVFLGLARWLSPFFVLFSTGTAGLACYRLIYVRSYTYTITQELVKLQHGVFSKRADQIEMFRIKDYIVTQSFLQQLFKLMDVILKTTDPENHSIRLQGIPESDIIDIIRARVQEARRHNQIYEIN
ncbi:PH domain-containing protein [Mucilaginibacter sp. cycad4]|uniref:PH domain-containing protein n=1 Tax=Mucilaginibacter sp. cycad4 TaxID=3342096 RepID=UPI002AAB9546|nr:PH domain-containing protein [Mucilaginibacter gossypii]WPU99115.1 PH domain-containing protein [Mucilaginibacter gossypii]